MVAHFTNENFDAQIDSGALTLIDFFANWCGPCQQMSPVLDSISEAYDGRLTVGKVDTDQYPGLAMAYNVSMIPNMLLFKNGEVIENIVGVQTEEDLRAVIDKYL